MVVSPEIVLVFCHTPNVALYTNKSPVCGFVISTSCSSFISHPLLILIKIEPTVALTLTTYPIKTV